MAGDFHAIQAQHPHAPAVEMPVRAGVVAAAATPGPFPRARGGDLQVEALHAPVREPRA